MPKSHDAWVLVATWRLENTSVIVTLNPILYVKVNGCVGVFVFGFFGDGESYIVKKSLSKINPTDNYILYHYFRLSGRAALLQADSS